jgi:2-iminobutanoate/2-iminopropanoate deaminase
MTLFNTPDGPAAVGPYSHGAQSGNFIFCSGQAGQKPGTKELVSADLAMQTRQVLHNLSVVLAAQGAALNNVIKVNVYLTTMDSFEVMNKVYAEVFGQHKPARTTIAVYQLPLGALVEMECIAEVRVQQ